MAIKRRDESDCLRGRARHAFHPRLIDRRTTRLVIDAVERRLCVTGDVDENHDQKKKDLLHLDHLSTSDTTSVVSWRAGDLQFSGKFSSDRTVAEYARDIWDLRPAVIGNFAHASLAEK
ncbi:MAG TPA: hypothetical protein VF215_09600 [Thermoanaerobaculia bacterium]